MLSPKQVINIVTDHARYLEHNAQLIEIFEGCLLPFIEKDMARQFSPQMYIQAMHRCVPINILPKIIDKLTNIYNTAVIREVVEGSDQDKELLGWYEGKFEVNTQMNCSNELFNLCKTALIHPYVHDQKPCLRVILNDRFVLYSEDKVNPTVPTHVIILAGKKDGKDVYWTYSDTEFMISNSAEEVEYGLMAEYGNPDGINPIGNIPFVYINESHYRLMPKQDSDILKLTKIVPVMLTDLNVAAMYQSFSILYAINLDDENLKMSPNAFWRFKSDPTTGDKPEIGMLKPEVDYQQVLNLIEAELSMWMGTKGIRASTIGSLTPENYASGISKIIDEMDTFEARQKQVCYFQKAEQDLWNLVLKHMHPYWVREKLIENRALFTPTAEVTTTFPVQLPLQSRGQLVRDLKDEYQSGFISRERAVQKLNPDLTAEEIQELLLEIDEERSIRELPSTTEQAADQEEATQKEGASQIDGRQMDENNAEYT